MRYAAYATILEQLTTRDEAGVHFTEYMDHDTLVWLEDSGLIEITRPTHASTGIAYAQEYWTVSVTDAGKDFIAQYAA